LDFPKIKRDRIDLHGLGLVANIGVPEEERAVPQRLEADICLWPATPLSGLKEDLSRTVNYYDVAVACREEALRRERLLIETLAEDLCRLLLQRWPLAMVRVKVHKFILPDTRAVSVTLTRQPADFAAAAPA
jgi:dihydroneopterin aldolase